MRPLLAFVSLLLAGTASAEFTTAEKAEVHKLYLANQNAARAAHELELSVCTEETETVDATAVYRVSEGGGYLWGAIRYLANVDHLQHGNSTRSEYVADAVGLLESATDHFAAAIAALPTPCLTCDPGLARAAYYATEAYDYLVDFDTELDYTDYEPTTSQGFPRMFGPHGDWPAAQESLASQMHKVWVAYDGIMLAKQLHEICSYGFRVRRVLEFISDAYFAAWGHGDFGPSESTMRALVEEESPIATGLDLETIVGFYEIQRIHEQGGEVGATHHFPYLIAATLDCEQTPCSVQPSTSQTNLARDMGFAWRNLDDWAFQFTMIHYVPNPPTEEEIPRCRAGGRRNR